MQMHNNFITDANTTQEIEETRGNRVSLFLA